MIINETRKAIIELIEPYMNKEVEFWCLLQIVNDYWIDIQQYCYQLWLESFLTSSWLELENSNIDKIIWHYDITAVQNLLESKTFAEYILTIEDWSIIFSEIIKFCECDIPEITRQIFKIPNKPLHLYTDEEDKQLLELLLKLK